MHHIQEYYEVTDYRSTNPTTPRHLAASGPREPSQAKCGSQMPCSVTSRPISDVKHEVEVLSVDRQEKPSLVSPLWIPLVPGHRDLGCSLYCKKSPFRSQRWHCLTVNGLSLLSKREFLETRSRHHCLLTEGEFVVMMAFLSHLSFHFPCELGAWSPSGCFERDFLQWHGCRRIFWIWLFSLVT